MNILTFGEVLFDVFDGEEKIGGAAFNFAAHAARLGATVSLMSAVGGDERGRVVRQYLQKYGVDDAFLATVGLQTGICMVTLDEQRVPSYDLVRPTAWDAIPWSTAIRDRLQQKTYDLFYFGSLVQRDPVSAATLRSVLETIDAADMLFDCNVRKPYVTAEALRLGLENCTHLKISREEIPALVSLGLVPAYDDGDRKAWCARVAGRYPVKQILLTLDKDGAAVYDAPSGTFCQREAEKVKVVSTVGAGDSFAAGYMMSQLNGDPVAVSLEKAVLLSSRIIQIAGALPE